MANTRSGYGRRWLFLLDAIANPPMSACMIWPHHINLHGYGTVYDPRLRHQVLAHSVACEHQHGPRPSTLHEAAHGPCHNRACFNPLHVSWRTCAENNHDKYRDGTTNRGERHGNAKLTGDDIREIRTTHAKGEATYAELGARFSVHKMTIGEIVRRERWSHVD